MLIAIIGPSGAGKDTLLDIARARLAGDDRFRFARRTITRPADAGGEAHLAITEVAFRALRDAGGFALSWEAHGLHYGIPAEIETDLALGRTVVASVSRTVIGQARRLRPTRVIEITASPELRARRLAARGRESEAGVAARLAREVARPADGEIITVTNDGTPEEGARALLAALGA